MSSTVVCAIVLYHKLADIYIRVVPMSSKLLTNLMKDFYQHLPIRLFPEHDSASLVPRPLSLGRDFSPVARHHLAEWPGNEANVQRHAREIKS